MMRDGTPTDPDTYLAFQRDRTAHEHSGRKATDKTGASRGLASRGLTNEERTAIRANASGEHVWCATDADARTIAEAACDHSDEWSDDAVDEAVAIARAAWEVDRMRTEGS